MGGHAYAQDAGAAGAEQTQLHGFNIDPQPLAEALVLFGQQSGMQVSAHGDLVRGLSSPGVTGTMTREQALTRMLAGTGLTFSLIGADTVTLAKLEDGGAGGTVLPPVTVYGARTTQTLDDVTSSVAIVPTETIEQRQIASFRDSFRMMGNVQDSDFTDAGFVIRGINSEGLTPGGAPVASLYIDGIQQTVQGARRGQRGLWDVEQVEIYRGPQSTLAGRAALAGAIYVKTKDPTYDYEAAGRALAGTDETFGGAAMANLPVMEDQVAVRLVAEYERSESDLNYPTYERFERFDEFVEDEYFNLRGKVLIEPMDLPDLVALVTYSYSEDAPTLQDIAGPGLGFDFDDERGDFNTPNFAEVRRTTVHNTGTEITYDLTPDLVLTSQTSFSKSDTDRSSINVGTPGETDVVLGDFVQNLATQELRLNYYGDRLETTTGLYGAYEYQDSERRRPDFFGFANDVNRADQEIWNVAVFGEASYEFVPSWKIVAGGRVDHTREDGFSFFSRNGVVTTDFSYSVEDTVFLPKVGVIKEFGPDHTVGFTVQRAFRAGGAGAQFSTGDVFEFGPEHAWNYELSYKGRLLDDRLKLAGNIFYLDLRDQQVEILEDPLDPLSAFTTNAASSRAYGFEIEAQAYATPELSGFVSVGYVETEFKEFDSASLGDLSGLSFPEAPQWSVAGGALYEHRSGFFVGVDAKYTGEFLARLGEAPQEELDDFTVVNAQLGYRQDGVTLTLFVENAFDEEYFLFNDNDVAATLGPRRFVGVALDLKF
jgi:outer membrane receptor protein involved in Fe transport